MYVLPRHPIPVARETFFSFLARFAAMNGVSASSFCLDRNVSLKRAISLEPAAVGRIAERAGLSSEALAEMLSWTGDRLGEVRTRVRGEVFVSRAVRSPVVRGCPVCLREDAEAHPERPGRAMAMRGDWQLREVSLCIQHGHPLVPLWEANAVVVRHDVRARLSEVEAAILSGHLDLPHEHVSPFDIWLDQRLETGADATWLADQSLYAATTICRLLGNELLRADDVQEGVNAESEVAGQNHQRHRAAQAAGFDVLRSGEVALRAALDRLAATALGPKAEPRKAFGRLFLKLNTDHRTDPTFEPFRRILRECIIDTWPIAGGEEVLGEVLPVRRLHSLGTAASETGVSSGVLARFLTEAGALPPNAKRYSTFDARRHAQLLKEIPTYVSPKAMTRAMGATLGELTSLEADGVLEPRSRDTSLKARWRIMDGVALVSDLDRRAAPVTREALEWERLQQARARTRVGLDRLIDAVRGGLLELGRLTDSATNGDTRTYHDLVVRRDAVSALVGGPSGSLERIAPPPTKSPSEFGRTIGLWNHGEVAALVEAGHTPSMLTRHPTTNWLQRRLSDDDIAAFHRRFVTFVTIARETGLHRNTIRARLAAEGVAPFSSGKQTFGLVYLRSEATRAIPELLEG